MVDRRLVVDQAHEHAQGLALALSESTAGTVAEVADALRSLTSDDAAPPLSVVRMRGGATWDAAWLRRPDLPGIVTGTVDQVGSRLFFRGYGVSSGRRPIDAALVGTDSLILVDEAHLATAMSTTVAAAQALDLPSVPAALPAPVMVQLSATRGPAPGNDDRWTYRLDPAAHGNDVEPVAARRLHANKRLTARPSTETTVVRDLAEAAVAGVQGDGSRVLVVCNTVDRARLVHDQLKKLLLVKCHRGLLIGRNRPIDGERLSAEAVRLFSPGPGRDADGPAVLVATQTVEVGVDLDATALITETASWDALVQRIGRVNRRGDLTTSAPVTVVHDAVADGPVYGGARDVTWAFLLDQTEPGGLDVSPSALCELNHAVPDGAYVESRATPLLLPSHLDAWARTSPAPSNDPPLESFLHGLGSSPAAVSVAWRDGLVTWNGEDFGEDLAGAMVDAVSLRSAECVEVPLGAVRRWLAGDAARPVSDVDAVDDDPFDFGDDLEFRALRREQGVDGKLAWAWVTAREVRPGDQLVVPSERGGLDAYGWAPDSNTTVRDVAEVVAFDAGRAVLRLDPGMPERLGLAPFGEEFWDHVTAIRRADDPGQVEDHQRAVTRKVAGALRSGAPDAPTWWTTGTRHELADLLSGHVGHTVPHVVTTRMRAPRPDATEPPLLVLRGVTDQRARWQELEDAESDGTVHTGERVTLAQHQEAVGERARRIATALGLHGAVLDNVVDAARWHDYGKVDPRFQAMLFGGDETRAVLSTEPIAKSGMDPGDSLLRREARVRSGLPRGALHEVWSAALVSGHLASLSTTYADSELVLHLVASHHGRARPLLPPIVDVGEHRLEATVEGREITTGLPRQVDLDDAERFHRLNARYGRWGLALLESIVRCADMTVSAEGS